MEALGEVIQAGKVRYIGFSEWPVEQVKRALAIPGAPRFVSSQPQYSLLHRDPEDKVIPLCAANGISQIVWSPLAQGVLTGKYQPGAAPPSDSRAASDKMGNNQAIKKLIEPHRLEAVQRLRPLADEAGCTMAQFALAWVLREPNIAAAIVGASHADQLNGNVVAADLQIDPALFQRAEAIVAGA
jgi:aryl-alcohol dehydrogenase-like predicted oxidoreductase